MTDDQNRKTNIMVVDDTIANLKLLEGILSRRGYRVRSFPRGRLALVAAALEPPDLILLDINIPEMNGYEMCTRLKADPLLAPIPVIFISALNEMLDKVKAFGCGGGGLHRQAVSNRGDSGPGGKPPESAAAAKRTGAAQRPVG